MSAEPLRGPWADEAVDVLRAVSGGLLFGIPLLYTMEMWWVGAASSPERLVLVLALTAVPVFALNRTGGFRESKDIRLGDALADTVEALAIAAVSALLVLVLLREVSLGAPVTDVAGKVVYETAPFAIGVALARHLIRQGREGNDDEDEGDGTDSSRSLNATLADLGATTIGAIFVALNIAPTDEVPMIAARLTGPWLAALVLASLAASYCIVFEAGFSNEEQRHQSQGILQRPVTETVAAYLVSLVAAGLMLWFFRRIGQGEPWTVTLSYVVVLGLPAAVGGAAGRLAT